MPSFLRSSTQAAVASALLFLKLSALTDTISIHEVQAGSACLTADAMIGGMRQYFTDWDKQLVEASNKTWNCIDFATYLYHSRDRIHTELQYTFGNMTTIPGSAVDTSSSSTTSEGGADGSESSSESSVTTESQSQPEPPPGFGEVHWIMSHVNQAASLVSASVHVNSGLGVIRGECFKNPAVHLLFFVTLRRVHQLMLNQVKYLWYMFQNTPDMYRGASSQWLQEAAQVFQGDLDTTSSIFGGWNPPNITIENRTDSDIMRFNRYERPGVFSIVELLRKMTFHENKYDKDLVRFLMRNIFDKNDLILELGAGTGEISIQFNETGWVRSHAYEYSNDIQLITFGKVNHLKVHQPPSRLGNNDVPYDWILCVNVQCKDMLQSILDYKTMNNMKSDSEKTDSESESDTSSDGIIDHLREMMTKGIIFDKSAVDINAVVELFENDIQPIETPTSNNGLVLAEKYVVYKLKR